MSAGPGRPPLGPYLRLVLLRARLTACSAEWVLRWEQYGRACLGLADEVDVATG